MSNKGKIHYANYQSPNESDSTEYWGDPICGQLSENLTKYDDKVTCRNCLRSIHATKSKSIIINGISKKDHSRLHWALVAKHGNAKECEMPDCNSINPKRFEWALKKGHSYSTNPDDYIQMCPSCHRRYDFSEELRDKLKKAQRDIAQNKQKLTDSDVLDIIKRVIAGEQQISVAKRYGLKSGSTIADIKSGRSWKHMHKYWEILKHKNEHFA